MAANFDDLIPKSTLDNPFDNPFADVGGRPHSPDPWSVGASYYEQQPSAFDSDENAFANSYSHGTHTPQYEESEERYPTSFAEAKPLTPPALQKEIDPLDAEAVDREEPLQPDAPRGFKPLAIVKADSPPPKTAEILPPSEPKTPAAEPAPNQIETTPSSETPTSQDTPTPTPIQTSFETNSSENEIHLPSTSPSSEPSPSPYTSSSASPPIPSPETLHHVNPPSESEVLPPNVPVPSPPARYESIASPLTSPGQTRGSSMDRSFSGLALGGEVPGWGGSASSPLTYSGSPSASGHGYRAAPEPGSEEVEDDEDDRPLGVARSTFVAQVSAPAKEEAKMESPKFIITVGDPQKVGDPINAHIVYTVSTRTSSSDYKKSTFSVLRRYSDFLWLFDALASNNPGTVIPPVPEKSPFGRFAEQFVEARRLALNKCIQKIASHPRLAKDPDLRLFLESDSFSLDIKHRKVDGERSAGLIASIGTSITGPKFYETDEWFDKKKAYLEALESQLKGLIKAIENVSKQRTDVITAINEFTTAITVLGSSDLSKQLSSSLTIMADVERKEKELMEEQSRHDMETLLGTVEEYLRLIASVRLTFASRVKLFYAWKAAEAEKNRVRSMHEKTLRQRGLDRQSMVPLQREIEQAETKAQDARSEYDDCTKLIKQEVARFEHERVMDFKSSLEAFLEGMIVRQNDMIDAWEGYQQLLLKRAAQNPQSGLTVAPS